MPFQPNQNLLKKRINARKEIDNGRQMAVFAGLMAINQPGSQGDIWHYLN